MLQYSETDGSLIFYDWPIVSTFDWLCTTDADCEKLIGMFGADDFGEEPPVFKCGASIEYKIKAGGSNHIDNVN